MTDQEKIQEEKRETNRIRLFLKFASEHKWVLGTVILVCSTAATVIGWGFNSFYFNQRTKEIVYENKQSIDSVKVKVDRLEKRQDADDLKNEGVKEDIRDIKEMINVWIFGRKFTKDVEPPGNSQGEKNRDSTFINQNRE